MNNYNYRGPGPDPRGRRSRPLTVADFAEHQRQQAMARERHLLEIEKMREERRALAEKRKQAPAATKTTAAETTPVRPTPASTTNAPRAPMARPLFGAPTAEQAAEMNAPSRAFANRQLINVYGDDSPVAGVISAYRGAQHDVEAARAREQVQAARAASDAKINKQISEAVAPVLAAPMKAATPAPIVEPPVSTAESIYDQAFPGERQEIAARKAQEARDAQRISERMANLEAKNLPSGVSRVFDMPRSAPSPFRMSPEQQSQRLTQEKSMALSPDKNPLVPSQPTQIAEALGDLVSGVSTQGLSYFNTPEGEARETQERLQRFREQLARETERANQSDERASWLDRARSMDIPRAPRDLASGGNIGADPISNRFKPVPNIIDALMPKSFSDPRSMYYFPGKFY